LTERLPARAQSLRLVKIANNFAIKSSWHKKVSYLYHKNTDFCKIFRKLFLQGTPYQSWRKK
jgi:hypothetical protein